MRKLLKSLDFIMKAKGYLQYGYAFLNGVQVFKTNLEDIDNGRKVKLIDDDNNGKPDIFEKN